MRTDEYAAMYGVEDTHWWYVGMRHVADALLAARINGQRGALDILDAGCGTGGNSAHLQSYGRVTGVDVMAEAVGFARQRPGLRLALGSVDRLPFRDAAFDLALSNDVLCHLLVDDQAAASELARVLRPGGLLYLQLPAFDRLRSHHDAAVHTRHRYRATEVERLLRRAGLTPVRLTYANALLFPAAAAWRAAHKLGNPEATEHSDVHPIAPVVNSALKTALRAEAALVRRWRLPFGLSVIALAEKPR